MENINYDSVLQCYTLGYAGEVICLGADTLTEAEDEAEYIINDWQ